MTIEIKNKENRKISRHLESKQHTSKEDFQKKYWNTLKYKNENVAYQTLWNTGKTINESKVYFIKCTY